MERGVRLRFGPGRPVSQVAADLGVCHTAPTDFTQPRR
jgi:hypothetical protein